MPNKYSESEKEYGTASIARINVDSELLGAGGTLPPALVTVGYSDGYAYTIGDDSIFQVDIPLDWESNTDIDIYVRWACNEAYVAANGTIQWRAAWVLQSTGGNKVINQGFAGRQDSGDLAIPTLARQMTENKIASISSDYLADAQMIAVQLSRVATDAGAAPTAEPEIYQVWLQYTRFMAWGVASLNTH